ncbi:ERCC4 domain-containing protein [Peribacillus frigoritolerans]|uniref:ERCC4 domain-containing protein n=1 Tax=Peribacillus frigoritolerans TaxID=450367 RepID=UPI0024C19F8D|nr:ERCC4 domain-containing protein [Peribacillus frigoritolerans]WHX64429.1 ERCC4 domain-containing protein [Peribacillus frigoritolerans]
MQGLKYSFSDSEIKKLLSSIVILVDTREQQNSNILKYFDSRNILYKQKKLDYGDYSAYLPKNEGLGIQRDIFLSAAIERKNSVDELAGSIKERIRFENELIRAQRSPFVLMVEDSEGYEKIIRGDYRSQYSEKALLASLKSFETRYSFQAVFISPQTAGNYIYYHFYYMFRNLLK